MIKEKIGVVGAGLMGAEIALVYALAGHDVLLGDTADDVLAAALRRLAGIAEKGVASTRRKRRRRPSPASPSPPISRASPTATW
jgi:3-hydroxyacyl-CoA dehydrogenase